MASGEPRRNDDLDVLTDGFVAQIAEHPFSCRIPKNDGTMAIYCQHCIRGSIDHPRSNLSHLAKAPRLNKVGSELGQIAEDRLLRPGEAVPRDRIEDA